MVEPLANTTVLAVPELPNTLPVQPVPCVNTAPLANVTPLASAAVSEWPALENDMEPLTLPVEPVATASASALAPVMLSAEPLATDSAPAPPPSVSVFAAPA